MPVKIWTGLPGAGKTACMVAAILEFKKQYPDRAVYAINVNGLDSSVASVLTHEELQAWWDLPPGALICIDECQEDEFFPTDRGTPKEWVKRISKVRHEGMDFWMTTQHPTLMSGYIRKLVDQHVHSVRKFNTQTVQRFTWGRCMDKCESDSSQRTAVSSFGAIPKQVFDLYKSSNAHNMKRRIPMKAFLLPIAAVVAVAAIIAVPLMIKRMGEHNAASVAHAGSGVAGQNGSQGVKNADDALRSTNFAKWMAPRADGVPWSAPMFDGLTVQAVPRIYCVAVDDGRCHCMTEQGTRYEVKATTCRLMVSDGLYNPFQAPIREASRDQGVFRSAPVQPQAPPAIGTQPDPVNSSASLGRRESPIAAAYVPPTAGPWNPDPFGGSK